MSLWLQSLPNRKKIQLKLLLGGAVAFAYGALQLRRFSNQEKRNSTLVLQMVHHIKRSPAAKKVLGLPISLSEAHSIKGSTRASLAKASISATFISKNFPNGVIVECDARRSGFDWYLTRLQLGTPHPVDLLEEEGGEDLGRNLQ